MQEFFNRIGTLSLLLFLVLAKMAIMVLAITYSGIGLGPDEAQYWTWSRDLSWGYYSKPPGIAWQIWLGTAYFGDTEFGVRFISVILAGFYPFLLYFLAWTCGLTPLTCFWSGAIMALSPLGIASSFFAITDGGMIFFWILACITIAAALSNQTAPHYWLVGVLIALGALFKWNIYILWVFILCLFPFARQLINRHFFIGVLISLLGLLPSVIWNFEHDWVTFRHVFSTLFVPATSMMMTKGIMNGNFWEFLGAQVALVSPILFILLLASFWVFCKDLRQMPAALTFCGALCFATLGIFLILAVFKKMQGNWCDFAYPTGFVFLAWYCCERVPNTYSWLKGGVVLSLFLCLFAFSYPALQTILPFKTPYKINPFRHNLGWSQLKEDLQEFGYDPEKEFLFAEKYQMTSLLNFYGPSQKRAYFLNLHGARKNQFSFWPSMKEEQLGNTGYFVISENTPHLDQLDEAHIAQYRSLLLNYFNQVEFLGKRPLFTVHHQPVKEAAFFKCVEYNGKEPPESELY